MSRQLARLLFLASVIGAGTTVLLCLVEPSWVHLPPDDLSGIHTHPLEMPWARIGWDLAFLALCALRSGAHVHAARQLSHQLSHQLPDPVQLRTRRSAVAMYVGVAIAQCLVVAACEPRLGGIPLAVLVGWPVAFLAMARPSLVGPAFPTAQVIRAPLPHRTTV